jgi:hypothetical protein
VFRGGRCCVLKMPFVLKQEGDFYSLAGETYLRGIMNGEAVETWRGFETNLTMR